ncbi:MAG: sugar phosphate isomerase/epimerase [Treponema sp.]|jgi:sugar phosphate isomerase/epimerase|nr:sugar phosphate isomerase/epimerase [Treponema sp.]
MLAISSDYNGESKNAGVIKGTLARIAGSRFSHVHWGHEWSGDYSYSIYEMLQIKEWLRELGLKVKGIHASDGTRRSDPAMYRYLWTEQNTRSYTEENEYNRLAGVELIKNRIDLAHELETREVVLHMQLPYKSFEGDSRYKARYYAQACRSFDELEPYCRARHVRICVENLMGTPREHQLYQFKLLFERYDRDFLGLCFDTGHANVVWPDSLELARLYTGRIFIVHIHDNHGLRSPECWEDDLKMSACDEHLLPFEGTFDWEGFAGILAASPYEPPYLLESQMRGGDEGEYLSRAVKAGEAFAALAAKYC